MKIKYNPDIEKLEREHLRYFFKEIYNHKDVELVNCGEVELSISSSLSCIPKDNHTKIAVIIDRSDPHAKTNSYNIDDLIVAEMAATSNYEGIYFPSKSFSHVSNYLTPSVVDKYDIFSPPFLDPYDKLFTPQLKHAKVIVVPISLPEEIFYANFKKNRNIDVFFAGAVGNWYPLRQILHKKLMGMKNINYLFSFVSGHALLSKQKITTINQYELQLVDYAEKLRNSKISIFDGGVFNYPVKKYFECMACGCLVLAPIPRDGGRLGFVDGETMIQVNHLDFEEKMLYYLSNDTERERITNNAYQLYLEKYTCKQSADIFLEKIKELL